MVRDEGVSLLALLIALLHLLLLRDAEPPHVLQELLAPLFAAHGLRTGRLVLLAL